MRKLWFASIAVALLGSIYPFNFQPATLNAETIVAFLQSCCRMPGRGDIAGNILLFMPIGFTGMLAAGSRSRKHWQWLYVLWIAGVVALALQIAQFFLPTRDENLQDVLWNLIGTAAGAVLATYAARFVTARPGESMALVPVSLLAAWFIYRLIPFVPSIDWQHFKNSLKPLLSMDVSLAAVIHDFTGWLIVAYLLRLCRPEARLDAWLPVLILSVFALEVLIVYNSISLANVAGALLALPVWLGILNRSRSPEVTLIVLLLCTIVVSGLTPFRIGPVAGSFDWYPFSGFLDGSMYINTQSAVEKVFLYGSLVFLMWRSKISVVTSIIIGTGIVGLVEVAQIWLVGHTAEITDPLLVVFAALTLLALKSQETAHDPHRHARTIETPDGSRGVGPSAHKAESPGNGWVTRTVNLRQPQYDFLVRMSEESGDSVSRLIRQIVAHFIEELDDDTQVEQGLDVTAADDTVVVPIAPNAEQEAGKQRWFRQSVNLRDDQFRIIQRLSKEMGVSVSGVTRRIISRFIADTEASA